MSYILAPSVLSADFNNLGRDIEMINRSQADWFHVDVMDGVFVPNISFGFPIIKHIKKISTKPLDVHLMIVNPDRYIEEFAKVGADWLTVHFEACNHLHRTIQTIHNFGMKAGIALNPHTPVQSLVDIIQEIDLVLIMSVNPGFGGQKFISNTYKKVEETRELIEQSGSKAIIEVDGGVDLSNIQKLIDAGAKALVAGNAVFGTENPEATIGLMKKLE